jgi:hypothetical protein
MKTKNITKKREDLIQNQNLSSSKFGVVRGFTYGYGGAKADIFMPEVRKIGVGLIRLFLYWNQIEPKPCQYVWDSVDTFLNQLSPSDEAWIMIGTSSEWATYRSTHLHPPSPALDLNKYYDFITKLVNRCNSRVRFWQMDNEPHNPIFWAGTNQEFVEQLKVFYKAVKTTYSDSLIVLAGAAGIANPAFEQIPMKKTEREFFTYIMREGRDFYDVFDYHFYGDPYSIPTEIKFLRKMMIDMGYQKPIFAGEYNGPIFFIFSENFQYGQTVMKSMSTLTIEDPIMKAENEQAEKIAIKDLYARMTSLPPQTQMFMKGCPPEIENLRHRINCREIVMRNVLAFSNGVQKTVCWDLANEKSDPYKILHLMFDKFKIMDYEGGVVKKRYPAAETLNILIHKLEGFEQIQQINIPENENIYLFKIKHSARPTLYIVWIRRDTFSGENEPPFDFKWPWASFNANAIDAFGNIVQTEVANGYLSLRISITPIFIDEI